MNQQTLARLERSGGLLERIPRPMPSGLSAATGRSRAQPKQLRRGSS